MICSELRASLDDITDRIDAGFYNPEYFKVLNEMARIAKKPQRLAIAPLHEFLIQSPGELNLTGGATPLGATYIEEGITFIRVKNVRKNRLDSENVRYIPEFIHRGLLKRSQLKPEDVLLTITGMTYGLSCTVPGNLGEANINQHVVRIRVDRNKILPKFLSYFLNSKFGKTEMDRYVTGGTRPALDYETIKNLLILLPKDTGVQQSIIDKVSIYIEKANRCIQEFKEVVSEIPKIILNRIGIVMPRKEYEHFTIDICNDRIDAKYNSPFFKELQERIRKKSHAKLGRLIIKDKDISFKYSDSYNLIDLEDVDEDLGEVKQIKTVIDLGSRKIFLNQGRIIISKLQPEKGKIFIVNKETSGCVGSSEFIPFIITKTTNEILPKYLWCILRSPYVLKQWEFQITGSTRERIGEKEIKNTLIPVVNIKKQRSIISEIEKVVKKAQKLRITYNENIRNSDKLFLELLTGNI